MRNRSLLITIVLCCAAYLSMGQLNGVGEKSRSPWRFSSINSIGVAAGENYNSLLIQSVNGFRYKTWFMGAGLGLDAYRDISFPIFLDLRKSLFAKPSTPFLYADGGFQIMAEKNDKNKEQFDWKIFHPGVYYDVGAGYYFALKKKDALLMSVGYSRKEVEIEQGMGRFAYRFNRFSFKIGYKL